MKKWLVIGLVFTVVSLVLAYPYYYTLLVRTYLDVEGKASVKDSLTVYGNATVNGTLTYGSVVNAGAVSTIKGLIVGTSQNTTLYPLTVTNYGGTALVKFDSLGGIVGNSYLRDSVTFTGTQQSKAVYIAGALPTSEYVISKRIAIGVSTTIPTDSVSYGYMAKNDSVVFYRYNMGVLPSVNTQGKMSYVRIR